LDFAAGSGRHARYFAARGNRVVAVDRDPELRAALADVPRIETRTLDLETGQWQLAGETFDAIVVVCWTTASKSRVRAVFQIGAHSLHIHRPHSSGL